MDEDQQQQQPNPDQIDPAELARLRQIAERFTPFAEALEQDPSRYYAMRAAAEGRQLQQEQRPAPPPQKELTREEIEELNQRAIANPAEFMAEIAMRARNAATQDVWAQAAPLLETTADLTIDAFKGRKAATDSLFKQIEPLFDRELADVGRSALIGMTPAQRSRTLELRWNSAAATVYRKAAEQASRNAAATNLGGGSGGGSGGGGKEERKGLAARDAMAYAVAMRAGLSEEDMEEINKELEAEGF